MNFKYIFFPRHLKLKDTKFNKNIFINLYASQPTLMVDGLIESGDILTHIWQTGIKKLTPKSFQPQKILLLGLGGGSNTILVSKMFPKASITAVEIDPYMAEIGKTYFGLNKIKNLKIIIDDALHFVKTFSKDTKYDLILVDCFEGKYIPKKLENLDFIQALYDHSRFTLINRIYWYDHHEASVNFMRSLATRFFFVKAHTRSNVIISLV